MKDQIENLIKVNEEMISKSKKALKEAESDDMLLKTFHRASSQAMALINEVLKEIIKGESSTSYDERDN